VKRRKARELGRLLREGSFDYPLGCRVHARDRHFDEMEPVLGIRLYRPGPGGRFSPP
jgi:hypothetical protein